MKQRTIGQYLKQQYGRKIYKLSLDGGFSCPNRTSRGMGGCLFCSERGSGDFTESAMLSFEQQVEHQIERLKKKWPAIINARDTQSLLLHFQNYSGTYGTIEELMLRYTEASRVRGALGLVVSTRPDLIGEQQIELFKKFPVQWVELGLQIADNQILDDMAVGYSVADFTEAVQRLDEAGIPVVAHVMYGLPNTTDEDFYQTIDLIHRLNIFGIKIHMLNITSDCALAHLKSASEWQRDLPSAEHYIAVVKKALAMLSEDIIIHRLTGDGDHNKLIAPLWIKNKRSILNQIHRSV